MAYLLALQHSQQELKKPELLLSARLAVWSTVANAS